MLSTVTRHQRARKGSVSCRPVAPVIRACVVLVLLVRALPAVVRWEELLSFRWRKRVYVSNDVDRRWDSIRSIMYHSSSVSYPTCPTRKPRLDSWLTRPLLQDLASGGLRVDCFIRLL